MPSSSERDAQHDQWHDQLCKDHQEAIMRTLMRKPGVDDATAKDLCQETLAVAWLKRDKAPDESLERAWLHKIADYRWLNHIRKAQVKKELPTSYDPDTVGHLHLATPAEAEHGNDILDFCSVADGKLAGLSPTDREVLTLRYADDLNHGGIAHRLGITVGAARKRLERALKAARDLLPDSGRQHNSGKDQP